MKGIEPCEEEVDEAFDDLNSDGNGILEKFETLDYLAEKELDKKIWLSAS